LDVYQFSFSITWVVRLVICRLYQGILLGAGVRWSETSWRYISPKYVTAEHLTHHALQDALDQADIFKKMLEESRRLNLPIGANLT
jgi:hypothetical protein